jgi:hypothetical protein
MTRLVSDDQLASDDQLVGHDQLAGHDQLVTGRPTKVGFVPKCHASNEYCSFFHQSANQIHFHFFLTHFITTFQTDEFF